MTVAAPVLPLGLLVTAHEPRYSLTGLFCDITQDICEKLLESGVSASAEVLESNVPLILGSCSMSEDSRVQGYRIEFNIVGDIENQIIVEIDYSQKTIHDRYGLYVVHDYILKVGKNLCFVDLSKYIESSDAFADWIRDTMCWLIARTLTHEQSLKFCEPS